MQHHQTRQPAVCLLALQLGHWFGSTQAEAAPAHVRARQRRPVPFAGDSASKSDHDGDAVKERDATAQRDDNNAVQTSSEDDDSPAVQARTKRAVAIVESDDDESLDLD